jgi:hypothetical protein
MQRLVIGKDFRKCLRDRSRERLRVNIRINTSGEVCEDERAQK